MFVVAAEQAAVARDHPGIAGAEQRRALIAGGKLRELGDDVGARIVDGDTRGCRMGGAAGDAGVRKVGRTRSEFRLIESEAKAVGRDLRERGPGALAHIVRAAFDDP